MKIFFPAVALLWALATSAVAHELQNNRATLVLRDRQHLSLTLFVDYPKVLHQVLAPHSTVHQFMLMHSAMKPQEFQAQLLAAQHKLQGGVSITMRNGKTVALMQWIWPDAASVHKLLQQRAMQAVVAPNEHAHVVPMEIRAEATSRNTSDLKTVTLQLPAALQQVVVVSYQPQQVWLKPDTPSPVIRF
jgi:hypothetical protein